MYFDVDMPKILNDFLAYKKNSFTQDKEIHKMDWNMKEKEENNLNFGGEIPITPGYRKLRFRGIYKGEEKVFIKTRR